MDDDADLMGLLNYAVRREGYEVLTAGDGQQALARWEGTDALVTLAGSRYPLLEMPAQFVPPWMVELAFQLQLAGYVPVIAHPERNQAVIDRPALLQATVAAVLGGARGQAAVAQWIRERLEDGPDLLAALGFPAGRGACVATLHRVYRALDVGAFETAVGGWLARTGIADGDRGRGSRTGIADGDRGRGSRPTIRWRWTAKRCAVPAGTSRRGSTCRGCSWWRRTRIGRRRCWRRSAPQARARSRRRRGTCSRACPAPGAW